MRVVRLNYFILFISIILFSCTDKVDKIYLNRENILSAFRGKDILTYGDNLHLVIRSDTNKFDCYYKKTKKEGYKLIEVYNEDNLKISSIELNKVIEELLSFMDKYKINQFTSEYAKHGLTLKIILNNKEVLYVENLNDVNNKEWLKYIESSHKIGENWYWRKHIPSMR